MASQSSFGLSAARASASSRAPSPSDRGSGMYISGGGGFVSSRSNVGLWQGRGADIGRSFCGGIIGKAGHKMCIISGCGIAAHIGRKAEFPSDDDIVFIACPSPGGTGGDDPQQSVHLNPWVRASSLGDNLERYREERRSVLDWETLFAGLNSLAEDSTRSQLEEDLERLSKKLDVELTESKTPFKKRTKLEVVSPPEEFASIAEFAIEIIEELGADFVNDGTLREVVRQLTDGFSEIVSRVEINRSAIRTLSHETRDEFEMVDVKFSKVHSLLGKRGREDGTLSAFGVLQNVEEQVEALKATVQPAVALALVAPNQAKQQKQEIFEAMQAACNPLFQLFLKFSSDEQRPGDLVDRKFQKVELELKRLASKLSGEKTEGGFGSGNVVGVVAPLPPRINTFGLSGLPPVSPRVTISSSQPLELGSGSAGLGLRETEARFNALEAQLTELKNQMQAKAVVIGGRTFKSRAEVKSWLALHARAGPAYVFFVDVHSLMALKLGTTLEDAAADADFESKVRKNGYTTIDEANVASSFSRSLPAFFGKPSPTESRKLPALKTADAWEPKTMVDGAQDVLDRMLVAAGRELQSVSMEFLQGEGLLVAQSCIQTAVKFVTDLSTWMSREYVELLKRGGSEVECWGLIAHCVRAVFEDLHEARMPGRGPHLTMEDRAASSIWGCFQAQLKMQEFEKMGFAAHPTLSHILNIHLRDHTVSKATFEKVLARMATIESNAATTASTLRVLQSAVGEVKKAGKAGGGKP